MKYWEECLAYSFDENGVVATQAQIIAIASDIQCSHENYGMAFPVPENPLISELKTVKAELKREKEKVFCEECKGNGSITTAWGSRQSTSRCWKCHGEGKI